MNTYEFIQPRDKFFCEASAIVRQDELGAFMPKHDPIEDKSCRIVHPHNGDGLGFMPLGEMTNSKNVKLHVANTGREWSHNINRDSMKIKF